MRTRARLLVLVALAVLPAALSAQPIDISGTLPYTLEGVVAKDQASATEDAWFGISVGFLGDEKTPERWIGVNSFRNWNDDPFLGRQTLRSLMPGDPVLLVSGPSNLVTQLKTAPVGSQVMARGVLNKESRNFMLSALKVTPPGKGK